MVDGVCRCSISGRAKTDAGELYTVSSLSQRCVCWGKQVPTDSKFIFHLHHQCLWFDSIPFSRALPRLQDNKQHHVWLVSEFSGLERSICIGCCCVVTPVCLTTVAQALRKQKQTVVNTGGIKKIWPRPPHINTVCASEWFIWIVHLKVVYYFFCFTQIVNCKFSSCSIFLYVANHFSNVCPLEEWEIDQNLDVEAVSFWTHHI